MNGIIPFDERKTMTKKAWKIKQAEKRSMNGFNTGTRTFQDAKHPNRKKAKKNFQKELDKFLAE